LSGSVAPMNRGSERQTVSGDSRRTFRRFPACNRRRGIARARRRWHSGIASCSRSSRRDTRTVLVFDEFGNLTEQRNPQIRARDGVDPLGDLAIKGRQHLQPAARFARIRSMISLPGARSLSVSRPIIAHYGVDRRTGWTLTSMRTHRFCVAGWGHGWAPSNNPDTTFSLTAFRVQARFGLAGLWSEPVLQNWLLKDSCGRH